MKQLMILFGLLASVSAFAHPSPQPPVMPAEFDTLKKLLGIWEGTTDMNGKSMPMKVTYELTSGGTAITEKLGPGTPMEMISIYYKQGKSLAMTHYCAMNNHPQMKLKKSDAKSLSFEMTDTTGLSSAKEMHMHALTLILPDENTLNQEWTNYSGGKKGELAKFTFKRSH